MIQKVYLLIINLFLIQYVYCQEAIIVNMAGDSVHTFIMASSPQNILTRNGNFDLDSLVFVGFENREENKVSLYDRIESFDIDMSFDVVVNFDMERYRNIAKIAPKKANVILLSDFDSNDLEVFNNAVKLLLAEGYEMNNISESFLMAASKPKELSKKYAAGVSNISFVIKDGVMRIISYVSSPFGIGVPLIYGFSLTLNSREYRGAKRSTEKSLWRGGFERMDKFAKKYVEIYSAELSYEIEKVK